MKMRFKKVTRYYRLFRRFLYTLIGSEIFCVKCRKWVLVEDTYPHTGHKNSLRNMCKKCDNRLRTRRNEF